MKYPAKNIPFVLLILFVVTTLLLLAAQTAAQDFPAEPDTGFEIEGNAALDGVGDYDWETADYPPVVLLADPHSKAETDPTTFKPDGKFDKPEQWSILPGNVGPAQNELTNVMAWAIPPGELDGKPQDFWLIMGMERTKKEGTFFLDFEYNQLDWDGQSGGPDRSPGDIVVGFELKGNPVDRQSDLTVLIVQYFPGGSPSLCQVTPGIGDKPERVVVGSQPCPAYGRGDWYYRFLSDGGILAESGLGQATMNEQPFQAPWPSYDAKGNPRDMIGPFEFAEAAINLTKLGVEPTCSTFSSVHAKSRSSLEVTADLKDLTATLPLSTNCRIDGHKFLDIDGDGQWDRANEPPLEGWRIELSDGSSAETDADGYYEFEYLADGLYTVSEVCPDEWVQTAPGMTGFADCGQETFAVEINIRNREVNDLDFGNGRPALEVEKSCPADVFLGDDVDVEITVRNSGNVDLYDVLVTDEMIGLDETIDRLAPGQTESYQASYVASKVTSSGGIDLGSESDHRILLPLVLHNAAARIAQDPITNVVTVEGQYADVTLSESAECTTEVHELTVDKDAQTRFDRRYLWMIDKEVDPEGPVILYPGQIVALSYSITVDLADPPIMEGGWTVSGTITIDNPAPIDAELVEVGDDISGGFTAEVDCPSLTVPAGDSLVCTYGPTSLPDAATRTNTATAVLLNNNGATTEFVATAPVVFEDTGQALDETVEVFDSAAQDANNPTGLIGTVSADQAPVTFTYERSLGPFSVDQCVDAQQQLDNIAKIVGVDSGTELQATARVTYLCISTISVAFEDLPLGTNNDWDYNDVVLDVRPFLAYSDDGDLLSASFEVEKGGALAAFTHSFHFQPTAFACDGTYTRRVGGVIVDDQVPYMSGDDILIIANSKLATEPVQLIIEFDVPAPGACPLDLSQPEFDLIGRFHGEGLFFAPWLLVTNTSDGSTYPIRPADARLLNVPGDWSWPPEDVAVWVCYPDGVEPPVPGNLPAGPVFSELWWQQQSQCS